MLTIAETILEQAGSSRLLPLEKRRERALELAQAYPHETKGDVLTFTDGSTLDLSTLEAS